MLPDQLHAVCCFAMQKVGRFGLRSRSRHSPRDLNELNMPEEENRSSSDRMTAFFSVLEADGMNRGVLFEQAAPKRRWDSNDQPKQE